MLEVPDAPAHLELLAQVVGERQDDVVVGLRDRTPSPPASTIARSTSGA
jgi:hypothetical protein